MIGISGSGDGGDVGNGGGGGAKERIAVTGVGVAFLSHVNEISR